jgi:hypothetical protein
MSNQDLLLEPKDLKASIESDPSSQSTTTRVRRDRWWFYEESGGLHVVHEARASDDNTEGRWLLTGSCVVPWRSVRAALRRKDK